MSSVLDEVAMAVFIGDSLVVLVIFVSLPHLQWSSSQPLVSLIGHMLFVRVAWRIGRLAIRRW